MNKTTSLLSAGTIMCASLLTSCKDPSAIHTDPNDVREIIVAVSPHLDRDYRKSLWEGLGRLVLEDCQPGDCVTVYDGFALREIAQLKVPNQHVMGKSPTARAKRLAVEFQRLKAFLGSEEQVESPAGAPDGALLVPQFVAHITAQPRQAPNSTILLVGNPLYINPKDVAWSMDECRVPSAGHLAADSRRTTFGCADRAGSLENFSVFQVYPDLDCFQFEKHQQMVQDWWKSWFHTLGAKTGLASADLAPVLRCVNENSVPEDSVATPEIDDDKVMMLTAVPRVSDSELVVEHEPEAEAGENDWLDSTKDSEVEQDDPATEPEPRSPRVEDLRVSLQWFDKVDLDLYLRPHPGAEELFYERGRTAEGILEKDHLSAPPGVNGFETVTITTPIEDVRDVSAAINLYRSELPNGCDCVIRVFADGDVFSHTVHIDAPAGTRGEVSGSREADPAWVTIDLATIIGVVPSTAVAITEGGE